MQNICDEMFASYQNTGTKQKPQGSKLMHDRNRRIQQQPLSTMSPQRLGALQPSQLVPSASKVVHCIAVDPRSPSGMSACWFVSAEEADAAFVRMADSRAIESSTLERFKLSVPASATRDKIDELAMTAVQWQSYLPIVRRDGERRAANDSGMAPLGSYDLNWPHDMDPEVGIRPPRA